MIPEMNYDSCEERCLRVWNVLIARATALEGPIPYVELAEEADVPFGGLRAGQYVRQIEQYCLDHGHPLLNALAVNGRTRRPGLRFGGDPAVEMPRALNHNWGAVAAPTAEDFRQYC